MTQDRGFAPGGFVGGDAQTVRLERLDDCRNGHPLWRIDFGRPEHIISAEDVREGRAPELLACQREVDEEFAP